MSAPIDVLIAGAGPTGLTLALALDLQGIRVRLIDKAPSFSGDSKAITLQPRTLEVFQLLGVSERIVQAGVPTARMNMYVGLERATVLRYDRLQSDFPFYLHLHQGQTERELVQVLEGRGLTVERSTSLEHLLQDESGVTAMLRRGDGSQEHVRARFLVGCDGGRSRVRAALGLGFVGERHDDNWIMTDVRIPNMSLPRDERHGFILERIPFVVLPLGGDYYRLISARPPGSENKGKEPTLDEFRDIMAPLGFGHWRLEEPLWVTHYHPSQFLVDRYRQGNVFVAGDAAHVNTPIAAQGLNTGVLDAINLAWKLRLAVSGRASERLLDSYHEERHAAALSMFAENNRLTRLVFGANPVLRALARKRLLLLNLPRQNMNNVLQTSQLGLHYRHSRAVQPAFDARGTREARRAFGNERALPGDRAPHFTLDSERRLSLYELLRPERHTLLLLGGDKPDGATLRTLATRARERHGDWLDIHFIFEGRIPPGFDEGGTGRVWSDPHRGAHLALGARGAGCVLLRPDAYIATRFPVEAPESLDAYFGAILQ
ncbi:NAD(P)-binding protein [Archangium violaceum]|uniref:FAD-dependent monooxygenase n=1 Tax=Archangium violaceum TaxID=83451 RepID=UPI002B28B3B5|nr:NAD(P)-binding protein [Archangium violaceum]